MTKVNIKNMFINEIEELLESISEQKYRGKQIFEWIHKGVNSFDEMTNLSKDLRKKLSHIAYIDAPKIYKKFESQQDETKKYLIELSDNNIIECVLMKYHHGYSVCISSQVGCRMGCKFCASTVKGLNRNLETSEMLDQVLIISKDIGQRISNIVIMGIGEPFDNYNNMIRFLKLVNSKDGINIGFRHITVSTCGIVDKIIDLSREGIPVNLAISLHAPNDSIRKKIMPVGQKYSIDEILNACKIYTEKTKRRVTFEYAMISNVNDSEIHAEELASKVKNILCHINLIPVNMIEERNYFRSNTKTINRFYDILIRNGIETTIRRELGSDISASCGQLRGQYIKQ